MRLVSNHSLATKDSPYYGRKQVWDEDTKSWRNETKEDIAAKKWVEKKVIELGIFDRPDEKAKIVESKDKCADIDWYVYGEHSSTLHTVVEVKSRWCFSTDHKEGPYLNLRKYSALMKAYEEHKALPFYIVNFFDAVYMVYVPFVDATNIKKNAGCSRYVKSQYDVEDCIILPPSTLSLICKFG
jgi:hypothetical protein